MAAMALSEVLQAIHPKRRRSEPDWRSPLQNARAEWSSVQPHYLPTQPYVRPDSGYLAGLTLVSRGVESAQFGGGDVEIGVSR